MVKEEQVQVLADLRRVENAILAQVREPKVMQKLGCNPILEMNSDYMKIWIDSYAFWLEVYSDAACFDLYAVDSSSAHELSTEIKQAGFVLEHHSIKDGKHYFTPRVRLTYLHPSTEIFDALIDDIILLLSVSQKKN